MAVARMTPAANALTTKKPSFSGFSEGSLRPRIGRRTPSPPATRMQAMAASLSARSWDLLWGEGEVGVHSQEERERKGRERREEEKRRSLREAIEG